MSAWAIVRNPRGGKEENGPDIHVLHAHDNIVVVVQEGAIEIDNVFRVTAVHDLELAHDSLPHLPLCLNVNHLQRRWLEVGSRASRR